MKTGIKIWVLLGLLHLNYIGVSAEDIKLPPLFNGTYTAKSAGSSFKPFVDGKHYTIVSKDGTQLQKYAYETGELVEVLFDTKRAQGVPIETFSEYLIADSGHHIILLTDRRSIYRRSADYKAYHYDVRRNLVTPLNIKDGRVRVPLLSPDGRMCAYVINNDIYIKKFDYDTEVRVTTDGQLNKILNGVTDWVYEEELYLTSLMSWSEDSQYLAFARTDESPVKTFDMTMFGTGTYPYIYSFKYPKAGEENSKLQVILYHIDHRKSEIIDLPELRKKEFYLPRLEFWRDHLYLFTLNRHQSELQVFQVNPKSLVSKLWFQDRNETYIDSNEWVRQLLLTNAGVYYVSDESGRPQIYRYDKNGVRQAQVTNQEYDVTSLYGVAPSGEVIYAMAYPTPMDRVVVAQDSKGRLRYLSPERGVSSATFSQDLSYYLLSHSTLTELPQYHIYKTKDGKPVILLEDNTELREKLKSVAYPKKEFITVHTKSGQALNGWMIKPLNFDPHKQYPMVMTQYSGPGSQTVMNRFSFGWEEYLAQEGFIVVSIDGRGTGGRGSEFMKSTYLRLGILEAQDQIEAAQALSQMPYIDAKRIGIFGWSFGGYTVLMSMVHGAGTFAAGVAVAPPTDWRFYDSIYTERYMRTPQENESGYNETSVLSNIGQLQGALLVVHGSADDNVHLQNVMHLFSALVEADKDFSSLIYTDKDHGIRGENNRNHLYRQITNHFKKNL